ncbi:hypothetical protein ASNO1_39460 [Corallococcus caeni]|uniref:Porin n=1 Tax=Corallococcus caeni TaxID=3082388 RepID=A0ABQ6QWN5_9BACT|nr:hypothetical protein ASNO1_39460 [Corallococcus sp. NO1]
MRPVTSWLPWLPLFPALLLAPRAHAQSEERPAPLAFADFSWLPGNVGASEKPLSFGPFTGEFRLDTAYHYSFNRPQDDTLSGSSEVFRHGEVQVTQLGIGGDFLYKNVMGRLMTQFGMYSRTTPRNDASPSRGQWNLDDAYRYVSEAYGGYHFEALRGINQDRAVARQWLAVVWPLQRRVRRGRAGAVAAHGLAVGGGQPVLRLGHAGEPGPQARAHRRQRDGEVPGHAGGLRHEGGGVAHARRGL